MKKAEGNEKEQVKEENNSKEKIANIIQSAKKDGKITYLLNNGYKYKEFPENFRDMQDQDVRYMHDCLLEQSKIDYRLKILPCYNDAVFVSLCDSIFEICRFMGRPAFYDYGMEILTVLLRPQYSSTVRDYARITLTRIAKLKI